MILWAMVICAVVGLFLGTHCRLLLLAVASGLVVACLPLLGRTPESAPMESVPVSGGFAILGLLVILQASFLVGAVWRVSGPRLPFPAGRPSGALRLRPAAAREAGGERGFIN